MQLLEYSFVRRCSSYTGYITDKLWKAVGRWDQRQTEGECICICAFYASAFMSVFVFISNLDFSDKLLKGGGRMDQRQPEGCCIDRQHSCRDETLQNSVYKHTAPPMLSSQTGV